MSQRIPDSKKPAPREIPGSEMVELDKLAEGSISPIAIAGYKSHSSKVPRHLNWSNAKGVHDSNGTIEGSKGFEPITHKIAPNTYEPHPLPKKGKP